MNDPSNMILDFFFEFSRTEHALKQLGYFIGAGDQSAHSNKVTLDWERVADEVAAMGQELPRCIVAINATPPSKQKVRHGAIVWEVGEQGGRSEIEWSFELIRRVRNNLFHGEKFFGDVEISARDQELLVLGLDILRWLRIQIPNLALAFPA